MNKTFNLIILLSFNLIFLFGCGKKTTEKKAETQLKYVSTSEIKLQEFKHYLEVQGRVDGDDNVSVSPKGVGVITQIFVNNGDHVRKGQILAQLDDAVLQNGLKELKSGLEFATDLYEKQKSLWDKKIGSEVQYLTAKNNKESLENKMATLKDQIDMMKVKSPIDGDVEDVPVKVGQSLAPGMTAFRVINFSHVKIVAEVAEAYSAKIKTGDDVIISIPDLNKEIKAKITFSSKYINPVNRTFIVEVKLNPKDIDARANLIAVIKINDYQVKSAIVIPVNYIQKSMEGQFVVLANENQPSKLTAHRQKIISGMIYNGMAEIKSGLKEGDKIISAGYLDLNEGQAITINN
jgi:membrane fusion protein, multidrug efflux system